jgi:hypothetical protein
VKHNYILLSSTNPKFSSNNIEPAKNYGHPFHQVTVSGFVRICASISLFCRFFSVFARSLGFAPRLPSCFCFGQVCFWSFLLSRENEAHGLPNPQFWISGPPLGTLNSSI